MKNRETVKDHIEEHGSNWNWFIHSMSFFFVLFHSHSSLSAAYSHSLSTSMLPFFFSAKAECYTKMSIHVFRGLKLHSVSVICFYHQKWMNIFIQPGLVTFTASANKPSRWPLTRWQLSLGRRNTWPSVFSVQWDTSGYKACCQWLVYFFLIGVIKKLHRTRIKRDKLLTIFKKNSISRTFVLTCYTLATLAFSQNLLLPTFCNMLKTDWFSWNKCYCDLR